MEGNVHLYWHIPSGYVTGPMALRSAEPLPSPRRPDRHAENPKPPVGRGVIEAIETIEVIEAIEAIA